MCSCQEAVNLELVGGEPLTLPRLHKDISDYIFDHNDKGQFNSALYHRDNFGKHIRRLLEVKQVLIFKSGDELKGVCGWALVNDMSKVNKLRWTLPEDITNGNILYVSFAALDKESNIFNIKTFFETNRFRNKINRVFWGRPQKSKLFNMEVRNEF